MTNGILKVTVSSNRQCMLPQQARLTLAQKENIENPIFHVFLDGSPSIDQEMRSISNEYDNIMYIHIPQDDAEGLANGEIPHGLEGIVQEHMKTPEIRHAAYEHYYATWRDRVYRPNPNYMTLGEMRNIAIACGAHGLSNIYNIEKKDIIVVTQDDDDWHGPDYLPAVIEAFSANPRLSMVKPKRMLVLHLPTMTIGEFDHEFHGRPGILIKGRDAKYVEKCTVYTDKDSQTPDSNGYKGSNGTCMSYRYQCWEAQHHVMHGDQQFAAITGFPLLRKHEDHYAYDHWVSQKVAAGELDDVQFLDLPSSAFGRFTLASVSQSDMHRAVMPGSLGGMFDSQFYQNNWYKLEDDQLSAGQAFPPENWHDAVKETIKLVAPLINQATDQAASDQSHPDHNFFKALGEAATAKNKLPHEVLEEYFVQSPLCPLEHMMQSQQSRS